MSEITKKDPAKHKGDDFEREIKRFAESIDCLLISLPSVMATMEVAVNKQQAEFMALLKASGAQQTIEDNTIKFSLSGPNAANVIKQERALNNNLTAYRLIHRSFLTSQISQYDAYLGRLLRLVFLVHPDKLNSSEKQFTFKELVQYQTLEEAREALIEREVDTVVRKSHEDQVAWIKTNLKLPVTEFVPELPDFIEIAQRRHLFVHCDGVVSAPYIANCSGAGVKLPQEVVLGHQLEVTREYLEQAFEIVYAVGVKIGFAVWLNLFKQDADQAAKCLNALAFDLIANSRYSLATNLLAFALSGKTKPTEEILFRFLILNLAQCHKWRGDNATCSRILGERDWSACSDDIKLAVAVLQDRFDDAIPLIRKLRHEPVFKKEFYQDWPIFRGLRKEARFLACYKEIYGEEFAHHTVVSTKADGPALPTSNPPGAK
ncbi:MAG: hypothetical protein U1F83_18910 [Verrucomicrobiota bacterium]